MRIRLDHGTPVPPFEQIRAQIALHVAAGRRGTRITAAPPVAHDVAQRSEEIEAAADRFALAAQEWNVATDEALEAVIIALRRTSNERSR